MTTVSEANPTVARRRLAVYFRKLRERHELSLDKLSSILGVAPSQASRLDTGARGFQVEDVERLARWYGLDEVERVRLVALAEEGRKRAWWQQFEIAPALRTMIGMEQAALSISEYCGGVIPGLLQTPEYARAAVRAGEMDVPRRKLDDVVQVRMRRQQILTRERPPELWVVIEEAALARVAGGPAVMRAQLEHLHTKATEPNITVQVIGFEYGLYPGAGGNHFILLEMNDGLPDVLYTESLQEQSDTTDALKVRTARKLWDTMRALALSPRDSSDRIMQYIEQLAR